MYRVMIQFFDKEDANRFYSVGDEYPRPGMDASDNRVKFLLSNNYIALEPEEPGALTRNKINSMSTKELKKLAKENGFGGADQMVGFELKAALIEKLGL